MDKDSKSPGKKHPYAGLTVFFGTLHEKDRAVRPALEGLGIACRVVAVDTDRFGTFTGEIPRSGSIRETLRLKVRAVFEKEPDARLALASEGSFAPHPAFGFALCNHEALLLVDRLSEREFHSEVLSPRVRALELELSPRDDLAQALEKLGAPDHGVVVRPKDAPDPVVKGLRTFHGVARAMIDCFAESPEAKVILANDLRAHQNPTRMEGIARAAARLVEQLDSFCPGCKAIGFRPAVPEAGVPCSDCETPTAVLRGHTWACEACGHREFRPAENAPVSADPSRCPACNP